MLIAIRFALFSFRVVKTVHLSYFLARPFPSSFVI